MITRVNMKMRNQRGITGLETAIILIAFVVVASVFAYTVLSAGVFSSEKGKEAVHAGLEQVRSSMTIIGPVVAKDTDNDDNVDQIVFIVANAADGEGINLITTADADGDGDLGDETSPVHTTVITYIDASQSVDDMAWVKATVGKADSDNILESGEKFEITVDVSGTSPRLSISDEFTIEVKPKDGSSLTIERTMPPVVDKVTDLN